MSADPLLFVRVGDYSREFLEFARWASLQGIAVFEPPRDGLEELTPEEMQCDLMEECWLDDNIFRFLDERLELDSLVCGKMIVTSLSLDALEKFRALFYKETKIERMPDESCERKPSPPPSSFSSSAITYVPLPATVAATVEP